MAGLLPQPAEWPCSPNGQSVSRRDWLAFFEISNRWFWIRLEKKYTVARKNIGEKVKNHEMPCYP